MESDNLERMKQMFQSLSQDFFNELNVLNDNLTPTKYHRETFYKHCFDTGKNFSDGVEKNNMRLFKKYENFTYMKYNVFELTGMFHDVGKAIVHTSFGTSYTTFIGHAQCSSYIFQRFFSDIFPKNVIYVMSWCIDNHMCILRDDDQNVDVKSYLQLTLNNEYDVEDVWELLYYLQEADTKSRICDVSIKELEFSKYMEYTKTPNQLYLSKKNKIVIFLLGQSSYGKTTMAKQCLKELSSMNVVHLERDAELFKFAEKNLPNFTNQLNLGDIRQFLILNDKFQDFQDEWEKIVFNTLNDDDVDVCIIDTMQTLNFNSKSAKSIYNCLCNNERFFKLGIVLAPQLLFSNKNVKVSQCPSFQYKTYPTTYTEHLDGIKKKFHLHLSTGLTINFKNIIDNYNKLSHEKCSLIDLLKFYKTPERIIYKFPQLNVNFFSEYDCERFEISTFDYRKFKHQNVPTLDYRGESVLFDKQNNTIELLRGSLRVWETVDDLDKYLKCNENLKMINCKFIACEKIDGSLLNVTFIPKKDYRFDLLNVELCSKFKEHEIFARKSGLYIIGHRPRLISKNCDILKSINDAVGDWDVFIMKIESYIFENYICDRATFHFEFRSTSYDENLTVYYDKNFVKLFGLTLFNSMGTKQYELPKKSSQLDVVKFKTFENVNMLKTYLKESEQSLLDGDENVEPEGFVIHVINCENNKIYDTLKWKFPIYYIGHNPQYHSYANIIKIIHDEKISKRLIKFKNYNNKKNDFSKHIQMLFKDLNLNLKNDTRKEIFIKINQSKNIVSKINDSIELYVQKFLFKTVKTNFKTMILNHINGRYKIEENFENVEDVIKFNVISS